MSIIRKTGFWFIVLAATMWGFDAIVRFDLRSSGVPAIDIVLWEHLMAMVILIPVAIWKWKELISLKFKDYWVFAFIGLTASVLGTLFYTSAFVLASTSFAIVILMQQTQPVFTIISAKLILKEKLPTNFLAVALLSIIGVYLINFPDLKIDLNNEDRFWLAGSMGVLAAFFWGLAATLGKMELSKMSFWTATVLRFFFGWVFASFLLLILVLNYETVLNFFNLDFNPLSAKSFDASLFFENISSFIYILLFAGLGPLLIYYFGLQKTEAKKSAIAELMWPFVAVIISLTYDLETKKFDFRPDLFSYTQILGMIVLVGSVLYLGLQKDKSMPNSPSS